MYIYVYPGLLGGMVITRKGMAREDGSPKDVDREFVVLFSVINENQSPYLEHNLKTHTDHHEDLPPVDTSDELFIESNLMHSMNGYGLPPPPNLFWTLHFTLYALHFTLHSALYTKCFALHLHTTLPMSMCYTHHTLYTTIWTLLRLTSIFFFCTQCLEMGQI